MGILYAGISIFCSLAVAQFLKIAETRKISVFKILAVNYLVACGISFFSSREYGAGSFSLMDSPSIGLLILVGGLGFFFIANLWVYSRSIDKIGMGISIAAMRMSLIFPIALSLLYFNESLVWLRYIGIIVAFVALILMLPKIKRQEFSGLSDAWLPILIFIMTGFVDSGIKVYEEVFSAGISEDLFLSGIFFVAFLFGMGMLVRQRDLSFSLREIGYGAATGVVNLYSSVFLIYALQLMPGSVVFPMINVSLVILGTLIGVWFWKDQPTRRQWIGLAFAIVSITLLLI